jgi:hypothetical protein
MDRSRRNFLQSSTTALAAACLDVGTGSAWGQETAVAEPPQRTGAAGIEILLPQGRVPLSFVIDDSTCLVNMGHFCMPQFASAWPDRREYDKPWQTWPREIPDTFVREFGEWCAERGVKGKYSIVPYPACVGWLDRELPGWSRRQLQQSLQLVRELMVPHWDIHPEMITHTRVMDLATGRPLQEISDATMENSYPQSDKSVDELASYLAYALQILKNCGLPCEGITTPGGFGNRVRDKLPEAVDQAVRDVYGVDLPHFFKYVVSGSEPAAPTVHVLGKLNSALPRVTVSVPAGTGDWFGGWDGDEPSQGHRYCNDDATEGRMVELIERGEPAVMLCHWPGMYCHGSKQGFEDFKSIVTALHQRFAERTLWMKMSEIARYWAAKELTHVVRDGNAIRFDAPIATSRFTVRVKRSEQDASNPPQLVFQLQSRALREVARQSELAAGTFYRDGETIQACWDLQAGTSQLHV